MSTRIVEAGEPLCWHGYRLSGDCDRCGVTNGGMPSLDPKRGVFVPRDQMYPIWKFTPEGGLEKVSDL